MFQKKKAPSLPPFQHSDTCAILKTNPSVLIDDPRSISARDCLRREGRTCSLHCAGARNELKSQTRSPVINWRARIRGVCPSSLTTSMTSWKLPYGVSLLALFRSLMSSNSSLPTSVSAGTIL
jgi:hypothetical protein